MLVGFTLGGFLALGEFLDSVDNAITLVSWPVTIGGTTAILLVWVVLRLILPRWPFHVALNSGTIRVKKLGLRPTFALFGCLVLLWVPRIAELRHPASPKSGSLSSVDTSSSPNPIGTKVIEQHDGAERLQPDIAGGSIQQHTAGAYSPPIIANGDVTVTIAPK
jgi:hypothetical protein